MTREALKLALDALEGLEALLLSMGLTHLIVYGDAEKAITALQEALAEQSAQQEPVAWDNCRSEKQCRSWCGNLACGSHWNDTSPPAQRKPLTDEGIKTRTDEQIEATFKRCGGRWNGDHWVIEDADLHPFVRTIEGADLNTLRAISDEYNAWIKHHAAGHSYDDFLAKREAKLKEKNA